MIDEEDGHSELFKALMAAEKVGVGAPTLFETAMVLHSSKGPIARSALSRFLEQNEIIPIPFGESHAEVACRAFVCFGKGRHPARLNFGDCMTYATAKIAAAPLLFIGDDFTKTDLIAA
ncbi:MAG: PilT protein domain protein [Solirubrobacterales bacterium]|nr:PilT protein domain protein [Solirubrobacterales bacterium]